MKPNPHAQKLVKTLENLGQYYSRWAVFSDFVEMTACAIANSVDVVQHNAREAKFLEIEAKYQPNVSVK
jgi:hypothetical protein